VIRDAGNHPQSVGRSRPSVDWYQKDLSCELLLPCRDDTRPILCDDERTQKKHE